METSLSYADGRRKEHETSYREPIGPLVEYKMLLLIILVLLNYNIITTYMKIFHMPRLFESLNYVNACVVLYVLA